MLILARFFHSPASNCYPFLTIDAPHSNAPIKVKTIIRQNQKGALLEFLFGKAELNQDQILGLIPHLQDQMKALNNQVDSLQQKIIQLESKLENPKYPLSEPSQPLESSKTIQHGDFYAGRKKGALFDRK
jgi:hypothetical protein